MTSSAHEAADDGLEIPSGGGALALLVRIVASAFALFHLYTGFFGLLTGLNQRIVHLAFALALVFLVRAVGQRGIWLATELVLACCAVAVSAYAYSESADAMGLRAGIVLPADIVAGVVLLLLLLEATRRVIGPSLPIICIVFLFYAFVGSYFPGGFGHRGYDLERIVQQLFLSDEGFFGLPLAISANYLLLFVIFGAILKATSAGKFFIDLAFGAFGWARGGPAKMAVTGSALFGTMSGSAVANTVTTGTFTIPLMRKVGFSGTAAGAIEAVASTGGQIMPPVMGAAAFLIAEFLGKPYIAIAAAATIPALMYFSALFLMVDAEAGKLNIRGLAREELPDVRRTISRYGHLILSPCVLVFLLGYEQASALFAVTWSIVATLAIGFLRAHTRPSLRQIIEALQEGAMGGVTVAIACACSGIVIGILSMTGLGFKLSSVIIDLAQGSMLALLLLSMIASIILGTGLPTVPAYLLLAVLVAPALIQVGVEPIAAHMFIFVFGVVSAITPPVALAAFAAASLAKSNPITTGLMATKLGMAAYLIPFLFVYHPGLLLSGEWPSIAFAVASCSVAIFAFAAGVQGFMTRRLSIVERLVLLTCGLMLVLPELSTTLAGIAIACAMKSYTRFTAGRDERSNLSPDNSAAASLQNESGNQGMAAGRTSIQHHTEG